MTQTLVTPELKPQGNPYRLPEVLHGDWSGKHEEFTHGAWGAISPQNAFKEGGIEEVDFGDGNVIYVGYVQHREERVIPARPRIHALTVGNSTMRTAVRDLQSPRVIPAGRALYVAEVEGVSLVARANVHESPSGPCIGYFDSPRGDVESDIRRLHVMNEATLKLFGVILDSGPDVASNPSELDAWHELVAQQVAEANPDIQGAQAERFHFLAGPAISAA